jgi:pimeloyl-ACP methyl ester carboxylesterase
MEVTSRGYRISYAVEGQGEPLILISGFLMHKEHWVDYGYVAEFSPKYRVIYLDPLGHGASDKPHEPGVYSMAGFASDVVAVMDAEETDAAHVWGYSMGAAITFATASIYPDRVRSLVGGGASWKPLVADPEERNEQRREAADILRRGDWEGYWRTLGIPRSSPVAQLLEDGNDPQAMGAVQEGVTLPPARSNDLSRFRGRALVYMGTADALLQPPGCRERLEAMCEADGVELHLLDSLTHIAGYEAKDTVVPLIGNFLAKLGGVTPGSASGTPP